MADPVGTVSSVGIPLVATVTATSPPTIELAQQPPVALLLAATLAAIVVGRGGNGALLLRTNYGTLALKTDLALPAGSKVDLKLIPGPPPAVALLHVEEPGAQPSAVGPSTGLLVSAGKAPTAGGPAALAADPPSAQLDLGSEVEATVVSLPAGNQNATLAIGTRLVLRIVLPPPNAVSPLATSASAAPNFAGTVTASAPDTGGKTTVDTPIGTLVLDKRLTLPPGTTLNFERIATLPPTATLAQLDMGTVVEATVLSPAQADPTQTLAAGTRLVLRIATLLTPGAVAPQPAMLGTVVAGAGNETVIDTPLGTLALERRLALPPGAAISLQRLAALPPDQPADGPLAQRTSWPGLDQALSVLDRAAPELAARLRSDLAPRTGQQLAGTLLFLMNAVSNGTWPGNRATAALDNAGRHDLHLRLDSDMTELRRLADPPSGDWRVFVLPMLDGAIVKPLRLYLRRRTGGDAQSEQGTRFVLDVDMSRLGELQLDGLVRNQRFDLVLRSHRTITAEMRENIAEVFRNATSAAGLAGDIIFTTASRFNVAPLDALRGHIGVNA